ncbi:MAG: hypothetical protein LKE33_01515 [Acidaminococcus sp.]|jgi:ESS family glutamate:Na+ symporter|nr:hypothetical protein [Acidaminococcus sp.]
MSIASLFTDMGVMSVFLLVGLALREIFKPFQKFFIPASMIGGILALIMGPQVLNLVPIPKSYSSLSGNLINLILTCLVFGVTINKDKIANYLDYCCLATSLKGAQLALGVAVGAVLNIFWTDLPKEWGTMGVFAFLGGHGNATAVGKIYDRLGVPGMMDMGIVLSTIGLLAAIIGGIILINYGARRGWTAHIKANDGARIGVGKAILPPEKRFPIGMARVMNDSMNNLLLQFAFLMTAMLLGSGVFKFLGAYVNPFFKTFPRIINGVVGAIIMWPVMRKLGLGDLVDRKTISAISGMSLDIVVMAAVATMNLTFVATHAMPIAIYSIIMILFTAWYCIFYAKHTSEQDWYEKAMCAYGMGTGTSATGLALVRAMDPDAQSVAMEAHGVHNGTTALLTSTYFPAVVPMMAIANIWTAAGLGAIYAVGAFAVGWVLLRKRVAPLLKYRQ